MEGAMSEQKTFEESLNSCLFFTVKKLDPAEYGVSLMAGFGYRDQEITPKTRQPLEAIYQVVE